MEDWTEWSAVRGSSTPCLQHQWPLFEKKGSDTVVTTIFGGTIDPPPLLRTCRIQKKKNSHTLMGRWQGSAVGKLATMWFKTSLCRIQTQVGFPARSNNISNISFLQGKVSHTKLCHLMC